MVYDPKQMHFPWHEEVHPPDSPEKVVHVHNHWRRRPGTKSSPAKGGGKRQPNTPRDPGPN